MSSNNSNSNSNRINIFFSEDKYRNALKDADNYSKIKGFFQHPNKYLNFSYDNDIHNMNEGMIIGSFMDSVISNNGLYNYSSNDFIFLPNLTNSNENIKPQVLSALSYILNTSVKAYDYLENKYYYTYDPMVLANSTSFQKAVTDAYRYLNVKRAFNGFYDDVSKYRNYLIDNYLDGSTFKFNNNYRFENPVNTLVLNDNMFATFEKIYINFSRNKDYVIFSIEYNKELLSQNSHILNQVGFVFTYKNRKFKVLYDQLIIDWDNKFITGNDFKYTSKGVYNFNKDYKTYKYYLQEGLYQKGLEKIVSNNPELFEGFTVGKFGFLVYDDYGNIVKHVSDEEASKLALEGGVSATGKKIKGIDTFIEELAWHEENDLWDHPMDFYINNKEMPLQL